MSSSIKVGEPKPSADKTYSTRKVRRYRKKVADIQSYMGRRLSVLWVYLDTGAYNHQVERWRVPGDIVYAARNYGVTHVGLVIEDGTKMLAPVTTFQHWTAPPGVSLERSNGGITGYLVPEHMFAVKRPDDLTREQALIDRMKTSSK
jgi:hypothetical protein